MACSSLTIGAIAKECKNNTGGVKDVFIIKAEDITSIATDSTTETITGITAATGKTFAHWQFNSETANATSTATMDNAAGSFYVQTDLALVFSKMESVKRLQIKAATLDDTAVIFRDNNNRLWYMGYSNPVYASAMGAETGTAMGDRNGYTITLTDVSSDLLREVVMTAEDLAALGIVL